MTSPAFQRLLPLVLAVVPFLTHAAPAVSRPQPAATTSSQALSPADRADAIRTFVDRWGGHVQRVYRLDVQAWAMRLVPQFATGDAADLRAALARGTFEDAMAALDGGARRDAGSRGAAALAPLPPGPIDARTPAIAKALGDATQDLVYTPITPCRIVDTRNTAAGAIPAGGTRNFVGAGVGTYAGQGGANVSCGLSQEAPAALALNITAVTPAGPGYATAFAYGTAQPGTANVNYAGGDIVNNAIVVPIAAPSAPVDFTLFSYAQAHYVVDVIGYFDRPRSSPIECVNSATSIATVNAGATANLVATAACPAGYGATSVNCESTSWNMPLVFVSGNVCSARNNGTTQATLKASLRCCRIPGR
ncbi:MAG: hypothetical protein ACTHOH_06575 [Lysobacteraceae bacterium]